MTTQATHVLPAQPGIRERLLGSIDPVTMRGLEIGPLHSPRLTKDEANIRYLDHATREQLVAKYADNAQAAPHADRVVDVDFVWTPGRTLRQVLGDWAPVDYVIASHVVEHVANPIAWLQQIAESLSEGGVLSLVIPDKRYCFDARRQVTLLAQLVDLYLREVDVPTFQQIFDHESNFIGEVSAQALWDGLDPTTQIRGDVDSATRFALERCIEQRDTREYQDVHASVFTPSSFVGLMGDLSELGLTKFSVSEIYPTDPGSLEFFVTLRPVRTDDPERRLHQQLGDVKRARDKVAAFELVPEAAVGPALSSTDSFHVSRREQQLIEVKRKVLFAARNRARRRHR